MNEREMKRQAAAAVAQAFESLADEPDRLVALFTVEVFGGLRGTKPGKSVAAARARFAEHRRRLGDAELARALQEAGALDMLTRVWNGLGQSHYHGRGMIVLADWLIFLAPDAKTLGQLPYALGNWCGSWRELRRPAIAACERLAAAALARDPEDEGALWLYAQDDFLAAVNRGRRRRERILGPPVPRKTPEEAVAKIEHILARLEAGHHPLEVPSLDTIAVDTPAIVEALIRGLDSAAWRAQVRCVEALGRTTVAIDRVVEILCQVLDRPHLTDPVAMALHYELKARGAAAVDTLIATTERLLAGLDEKNTSDYRHQWPLRAFMTLAPYAPAPARERAADFLRQLLATLPSVPSWKRERLHELASEGPPLLRRLGRPL